MRKLLHLNDQLIWAATGILNYPLYNDQYYVGLRLTQQGSISGYWSQLPSGLLQIPGSSNDYTMQMVIDNSLNADYCFLQFTGEVDSMNFEVLDMNYRLDGKLHCWIWGLPETGPRTRSNNPWLNYDLLELPAGTINITKHDAWQQEAMAATGSVPASLPPYFGQCPVYEVGVPYSVTSTGFIFNCGGSSVPSLVPGDKWHFVIPIGKRQQGGMSISGMRRILVTMIISNPGLTAPPAEFDYLKLKNAQVWAHLYEGREYEFD